MTATSTSTVKIPRRESDKPAPMSFAQHRLWYLDQLDPDNSAYNTPSAFALEGDLDVDSFKSALNDIFTRHDVLRTSFETVDGQEVQVLNESLELDVPVEDLSGSADAKQALDERLEELTAQPFRLNEAPLVRAHLLKLGEKNHVLFFMTHHTVFDGWSFRVLLDELGTAYRARVEGKPPEWDELPIQYADYAEWQRAEMDGPERERQLNYWKEQLGGKLPVLELPTDKQRPAKQTYNGSWESLPIDQSLVSRLTALHKDEKATMNMLLVAAFNVLLGRYTGQTDLLIGTPIAGRNRPELERLAGFFVNTLVFRTNPGGRSGFQGTPETGASGVTRSVRQSGSAIRVPGR